MYYYFKGSWAEKFESLSRDLPVDMSDHLLRYDIYRLHFILEHGDILFYLLLHTCGSMHGRGHELN